MKRKLLVLSVSLVTTLGGLALLSAPDHAHAQTEVAPKGCEQRAGCRLTYEKCQSGWSSTGDPVTWCTCGYSCP